MGTYARLLVAVDLTDDCRLVTERALSLLDSADAELHIAHVIEPLRLAYGSEIQLDLSLVQESVNSQAQSHLNEFAEQYNIPESRRHLVFGRPDREVQRLAIEYDIEVIVVGSHGRHGIALLLGSTANGVLHGAPCDVLAVRVGLEAEN